MKRLTAMDGIVRCRREGSVRYKSGVGGRKTREALLDPKSHRRVNRRQVRQKISRQ